METLACQGQVYAKKQNFLGSKKIFLSNFVISNNKAVLLYEDKKIEINFDEMSGVLLREKKSELIIYLLKKEIELFFEDLVFLKQVFEIMDEAYKNYMINLIEEVGVDNVTIQLGKYEFLKKGSFTDATLKLPFNNVKKFEFVSPVFELTATNAKGKQKKIRIFRSQIRNLSLLLHILTELTEAEIIEEDDGFDRNVDVEKIGILTLEEIKQLKIRFDNHHKLENGIFIAYNEKQYPLEKVTGYEITTKEFKLTGLKAKNLEKESSYTIFINQTKAKNLEVLKTIVDRFTGMFEVSVSSIKEMTLKDVAQIKITFDSYNTLENGIFMYQSKERFSLEEMTGYKVEDKKCYLTGVSNRTKGKDRKEYINLDRDKAQNIEILEAIIDQFTDAVIVKKYSVVTKTNVSYHLSIDETSFKLNPSSSESWIDFTDLDGMRVYDDGKFLTLYFKTGLKYELNEENTDNLLRNSWDLYDKWNEYLRQMIADLGIEKTLIRFGDQIILKNGVFREVSQKGIKYSDALDVNIERKYFNIQCEGYGMLSYDPMNLDILQHIVFELSDGIEDYNRYWKPDRLKDEKMLDFEAKHGLTFNQEKDLAFSSILTITNYQSPRTFRLKKDMRNLIGKVGFKSTWGIGDKMSAINALDYLSKGEGHTPDAQEVFAKFLKFDTSEQATCLEENTSFSNDDLFFLNKYLGAKSNLIQLGYSEAELLAITDFSAWDYGRTGYIARYVVQLGYLSKEEAWPYVEDAANHARSVYSSWREYLAAYVLGRALGYGDSSGGIYKVLAFLLEDEESPFVRLEF